MESIVVMGKAWPVLHEPKEDLFEVLQTGHFGLAEKRIILRELWRQVGRPLSWSNLCYDSGERNVVASFYPPIPRVVSVTTQINAASWRWLGSSWTSGCQPVEGSLLFQGLDLNGPNRQRVAGLAEEKLAEYGLSLRSTSSVLNGELFICFHEVDRGLPREIGS